MAAIEIDADELEYTPEGLRLREPLELAAGAHHRIVIRRPARRKSVPASLGGFASGSSFPGPGVLALVLRPSFESIFDHLLDRKTTSIYQVFGHTSADGNDASNKELSDRRAQSVVALLTGDVEALRGLAKVEDWSTAEHQLMLRVLRCDPGPVDGDTGPMTKAAVELFQREYVSGVFHRHLDRELEDPQLVEDGVLGSKTEDALLDAFVAACSPHLDPARLHPTHASVGCSEFNLVSQTDPRLNRRAALVVHPQLAPHHDQAPCKAGDAGSCPVDERDELQRCPWYRAHVDDPRLDELVVMHFDLRWLPHKNGSIILSALTTLVDDADVVFEVFRTTPISDASAIAAGTLGQTLSSALPGVVRRGVAHAVWTPPEQFDLLSRTDAAVALDLRSGGRSQLGVPRARVPVFRIRGGGAEAISPPPGRELSRIPRDPVGANEPSPIGFAALDAFGRLYQHDSLPTGRTREQLHPLPDDEPRIWNVRHSLHRLKEGEE